MGELAFLEHAGSGYAKYHVARFCLDACILAGRLDDAESWLAALRRIEREDGSHGAAEQFAATSLKLAIAQVQDMSVLSLRLRKLEDVMLGSDISDTQWVLRVCRIKIALLEPSNGDPAKSWHPARTECRAPLRSPQNVHHRFEHNFLVLDYRLACVEFACGLPPTDQQYGVRPEVPPTIRLTPDIAARLAKARSALKVALRQAGALDMMLECAWRTKDVERRAAWLETLEAALVA